MVALRGGEGLWRGIYAPAIVLLVLLVLLVDGHICLLGIREPSNVPGIRRQRRGLTRRLTMCKMRKCAYKVVEERVRKENTE